ncbi:SPW repeat domain-containing protein [Bradyrhizobium sp. USDA 3650]
MRLLCTSIYGIADYAVGLVVLLLLPYLYDMHSTPKTILLLLGGSALVYSLLTDYELGLLPVIPFRSHLALDLLFGAFMIASSMLISFPQSSRMVVSSLGVLAILVVVLTGRDRADQGPTKTRT